MKKFKHKQTKKIGMLTAINASKEGIYYQLVFDDQSKAWFPKRHIDRDFEELTS